MSKLTWGNSSFKIKKTAGSENLTQALGGEWRGHTGLAPCPVCQSQRRADQRGLSIRADGGTLLAFCHKSGCDFRDVVKAAGLPRDAMHMDPEAASEAAAKREAYGGEQLAKARRLWATCKPLLGTKGQSYLRGRGITCPLPPALGWASDAFHGPSARWLSSMLPTPALVSIASGRRAAAEDSHYVAAAALHLNNENCEMKQPIVVPQKAGKALGPILGEPAILMNRRTV